MLGIQDVMVSVYMHTEAATFSSGGHTSSDGTATHCCCHTAGGSTAKTSC